MAEVVGGTEKAEEDREREGKREGHRTEEKRRTAGRKGETSVSSLPQAAGARAQ